MNKLPLHKRTMILNMLVEDSSMRSISRVVGVSINTVAKLLISAGEASAAHDVEWIVGLIDAMEPEPKKRGSYKKRISN